MADWDVVGTTPAPTGWDVVKREPAPEKPGYIERTAKYIGGVYKEEFEIGKEAVKGAGRIAKEIATPFASHKGEGEHPIEDIASGAKQAVTHPIDTAASVAKGVASTAEGVVKGDPKALAKTLTTAASVVTPGTVGVRAIRGAEDLAAIAEKGLATEVKDGVVAARAAEMPAADTLTTPVAQTVDESVRTAAQTAYDNLSQGREALSGPDWTRYRDTARALENNGVHFAHSPQGVDFLDEVWRIERGGFGAETEFGPEMRSMAKQIGDALSGTQDVPGKGLRPVNLQVLDEKLRELRKKQYDKGPTGLDAIQRERIGTFADKLDKALEEWVGPENYPRHAYAQLSRNLDLFNSDLGEFLTGRQAARFAEGGEGALKKGSRFADRAFRDVHSLNELRGMIGPKAANDLAMRHISNTLSPMTAEQARTWLLENRWVSEVPGAQQKILEYGQIKALREKNAASVKKWQTLAKKGVKYGAAAVGAYEGAKYLAPRYGYGPP